MQFIADQSHLMRDLAALTYNVRPDLALQISMQDPIRDALVADDHKQLEELAKHSDKNGFEQILPTVIENHSRFWATESLQDFAKVIANVHALEANPYLTYSKRLLLERVGDLRKTKIEVLSRYFPIFRLVHFCTKQQLNGVFSRLCDWVLDGLPAVDGQSFEHGQKWIVAIGSLSDEVISAHGNSSFDELKSTIGVPNSVPATIGAAYDCDQTKLHLKDFVVQSSKKAILEALKGDLTEEPQQFAYAWPQLIHLFDVKDCLALLENLVGYLLVNQLGEDAETSEILYKNLRELYKNVGGAASRTKAIKPLIESGALLVHAHKVKDLDSDGARDIVASVFWLNMVEAGVQGPDIANVQSVPHFGNIQTQLSWFTDEYENAEPSNWLVERVADFSIDGMTITSVLIGAVNESPDRNLFKASLRKIFVSGRAHPPENITFAYNFEALASILDDQLDQALRVVGNSPVTNPWNDVDYDNVSPALIRAIGGRTENVWIKLNEELDEWLKSLTSDDWVNALDEDLPAVVLLDTRSSIGKIQISAASLAKPLTDFVIAALAGEKAPKKEFSNVVDTLPTATRNKLPKDVYERHNGPTEAIEIALDAFPSVLDKLPFENDPNRTVERYILPAVQAEAEIADKFLLVHKTAFQKAMKDANSETTGPVVEYVQGLTGEDVQERAILLNATLGIKSSSYLEKKSSETSGRQTS